MVKINKSITFTKVVWALIAVSSSVLLLVDTQKVISVTNGAADRGAVWGEWELCPAGSHAHQFTTQNDFINIIPGQKDHTALNSVVLFCDDITGTNISSTLGFEGTFAGRSPSCEGVAGRPSPLTSFRLRVLPINAPNVTDNTAANDIEFICANGKVLAGTGNSEGDWGEYSDDCNSNGGICGIRTRQKPEGGIAADNTALNDVEFQCCT